MDIKLKLILFNESSIPFSLPVTVINITLTTKFTYLFNHLILSQDATIKKVNECFAAPIHLFTHHKLGTH